MEQELQELKNRMKAICYGNGDLISKKVWDKLSLSELRTMVIFMNDEVLDDIRNTTNEGRKRHCFVVQGLYRWMMTSPRNPVTNRYLTPLQQRHIRKSYEMFLKIKGNLDHLERQELRDMWITRLDQLCINDRDPISNKVWNQLSYVELRTIVRVLDDGTTIDFNDDNDETRRYCYVVQSLYRWTKNMGPFCKVTAAQKRHIEKAYETFLELKNALTQREQQELQEIRSNNFQSFHLRHLVSRNASTFGL